MKWLNSQTAAAAAAIIIAVAAPCRGETTMPLEAEVEARIRTVKVAGATVDMGTSLSENLPRIPYTQQAGGPCMVFSDDPEYFRVPEGIGARETVKPGVVRMYVYHVNGTTDSAKRITAVIDNLGSRPMTLKFRRYAFAGPSKNYHAVGKEGLVEFLSGTKLPPPRTIPPGGSETLDPAMEAVPVDYDELVHGFYEFEVDQPARLTTLQTTLDTSGPVASARLEKPLVTKKASGAGRGFFPFSDYTIANAPGYVLDSVNGPAQLIVADGVDDRWITGHDGDSTIPAQNKGNYGVLYNIRLQRQSSDGRGLALIAWNHRSENKWCWALAAAMIVSKGRFPAGLVQIPAEKIFMRGAPEASVIQIFPPVPKGKTDTIELVFSPPGASCLPVPLVFYPIDWPSAR
ncbi:MAG: hypothetical protein N2111_09305 [Candidatus Sumerlaeaceae bacterium]|nr:hypothetical protein [Candidatus Sumerlaeaceae bacterium]